MSDVTLTNIITEEHAGGLLTLSLVLSNGTVAHAELAIGQTAPQLEYSLELLAGAVRGCAAAKIYGFIPGYPSPEQQLFLIVMAEDGTLLTAEPVGGECEASLTLHRWANKRIGGCVVEYVERSELKAHPIVWPLLKDNPDVEVYL